MIELSLNKIEKYYGANKVLDDITFEVNSLDRIGIIGRNGSGKTTMFKVIAGLENYDGGVLALRKGASIGYLDQIPEYDSDYRVIDVLNTAFNEVFKVRREMRDMEIAMASLEGEELIRVMKKYSQVQNEFEVLGGYDIDEKISKVSSGLKMDEGFKDKEFNKLSGGEKTTVILGKILLQNPDILLLDEPSNHLDIESVEWLEGFLKEYQGAVLIISHDRYFLDKVVNKIVEIEDKKTSHYIGNYSYYVEEKRRRLEEMFAAYQNQNKKIKAMEEAIKRFRLWGTMADNEKMFIKARNMEKRIDKMDKVDKPIMERRKIDLSFNAEDRSGKDVIWVKDLKKSFHGKVILDGVNIHIRYGEKIALLGKNGSGKSTIVKILLGEYSKDQGEIKIGSNVKIGYLDQNINFKDENMTVLDAFRDEINVPMERARGILAKFLFYDEDVFKKVSSLSGGEKSRLKLCQLMHRDINLLILDEPTNHLDIDSREMLENALKDYNGTVFFISHDRYFINKIAEKIMEIRNKVLYDYIGNYDYYRNKVREEITKLEVVQENKKIIKKEKVKEKPRDDNKLLQREIEKLEKEIKDVEDLVIEKDKEMEKYSTNVEKLQEIFDEKLKLEEKLEDLLESWMTLNK